MLDFVSKLLIRTTFIKMKAGIHPNLKQTKVICTGCNTEFETLSVKDNITVSICSNCHPFFTGTKKLLDTEGRIQKFERRYKQAKEQSQGQNQKGSSEQNTEDKKKKTILKKVKK
jgi:large subunit ribosomal protein L31